MSSTISTTFANLPQTNSAPEIEIYKTLIKLNPGYMNDIFKLRNTDKLEKNIS